MSDFDIVKKGINLADFVHREFPDGRIFKIGNSWRRNPCPLCGHFDCFTLSSQRFYCFSCGEKGDVVDLTQKVRRITNVEALRYLANIIGFSSNCDLSRSKGGTQFRRGAHGGVVSGSTNERLARTEVKVSDEKRNESCRLRRIAADFYHGRLMSDKSGLEHQTGVRKHSIKILESNLIGFTAGSLIAHVAGFGIDPASLLEIGLAKKTAHTLKEYFPRAVYVYPHWGGGRVLYFTMKDPSGKMKFQIPKRRDLPDGRVFCYPDPSWVCYGQDSLAHDGCFLVEGENDRLTLLGAGEAHVAATIGNFCTPEVTSWLQKNAVGKTYYLAFDADDAGRKYADHYTTVILNAGGKVRLIDVKQGAERHR